MTPYIPLLFLFIFATILSGAFLIISHLLGPRKKGITKEMSYECGFDAIGTTRERFSVKFYLVAMLFILFDVEVVFLYPWAVLFRDFVKTGAGLFVFGEMVLFLGVLLVGLVYVYGRKAIDWE